MRRAIALGGLVISLLPLIFPSKSEAAERVVGYEPKPWAARIWASKPPADCPFEQSDDIVGISFTGRHVSYTNADTWYPSWSSDGNLYSPWTDGSVGETSCQSGWQDSSKARTGQAKILGDDPMNLQVVSLGTHLGAATPYGGRYPCGSLLHEGVWYYGTYCLDNEKVPGYNWGVLGPFVGFRISRDYGKTWSESPCTPADPLFGESSKGGKAVKIGAPHFVDFGRNMQHSPDGKAYLVGHGAEDSDPKPRPANLSWISGDQIYLARVKPTPETMNDPAEYEFFAGHDVNGEAIWTRDFSRIEPLVDWNNRCGCATVTYNPALKRYIMCVTDGWPTVATMNTYLLESKKITGPWKLVTFMEKFGEQGYFVNIPSKFIRPDGRTAWLCYSGNFTRDQKTNPPGGRYGMCLQEIRLLDRAMFEANRAGAREQQKDPLKSDRNLARQATVTVTSTYPGYTAEAAVDGCVGGYPEDISLEWAANGEKETAVLRLTWGEPQTVGCVWLFDRPNTAFDRVTSGMLVFSDGSTVPVGELPDDARAAREVTFEPRTISWLLFVVNSVTPTTQNTGLAEIAVFREKESK